MGKKTDLTADQIQRMRTLIASSCDDPGDDYLDWDGTDAAVQAAFESDFSAMARGLTRATKEGADEAAAWADQLAWVLSGTVPEPVRYCVAELRPRAAGGAPIELYVGINYGSIRPRMVDPYVWWARSWRQAADQAAHLRRLDPARTYVVRAEQITKTCRRCTGTGADPEQSEPPLGVAMAGSGIYTCNACGGSGVARG